MKHLKTLHRKTRGFKLELIRTGMIIVVFIVQLTMLVHQLNASSWS